MNYSFANRNAVHPSISLMIFASMMGPFVTGYTSHVESSVIGALAAVAAAVVKKRFTRKVFETATRGAVRRTGRCDACRNAPGSRRHDADRPHPNLHCCTTLTDAEVGRRVCGMAIAARAEMTSIDPLSGGRRLTTAGSLYMCAVIHFSAIWGG